MGTTIQHMSIADLAAASRLFGGEVFDGTPVDLRDLPRIGGRFDGGPSRCAGVVHGGELVDGNHRVAGLVAWADGEEDRLAELVPVVVTDDAALVSAILAAKDDGENDVGALLLAALVPAAA